MNSYEACTRHINGHLPYCCQCQEESLRDLLRGVANAHVLVYEEVGPLEGPTEVVVQIALPGSLWVQLAPLRSGNKKEG